MPHFAPKVRRPRSSRVAYSVVHFPSEYVFGFRRHMHLNRRHRLHASTRVFSSRTITIGTHITRFSALAGRNPSARLTELIPRIAGLETSLNGSAVNAHHSSHT